MPSQNFRNFVPITPIQNEFGQAFNDTDGNVPNGWSTEGTSVLTSTDTNTIPGFWYLRSSNLYPTWSYSKQFDIVGTDMTGWVSMTINDLYTRDGVYQDDVDWTFSMCADDGGSIDEDEMITCRLRWDGTAGIWKVRGEITDNGSTKTGDWIHLSMPPQRYQIRLTINDLDKSSGTNTARVYIGSEPHYDSHIQLLSTNVSATSYDEPWCHIKRERSATGVEDYTYMSGVDFLNVP